MNALFPSPATPTVVPMPETYAWTDAALVAHTGGLFMYYQQASPSGATALQTTLLAFSADGITWKRYGIVIDVDPADKKVGDGHFGYAKVFLVGSLYVAYHLLGGNDGMSDMGVSYSHDGITWQTDPRGLGNSSDLTGFTDKRFNWHGCNLVNWLGQPYVLGGVAAYTGGATNTASAWAFAPLSPDLRSLAAPPADIAPAVQAWENDVVAGITSTVEYEGVTYLYYRGIGPYGAFGVAKIVPNQSAAYKPITGGSALSRALIRDPAGVIVPRGRVVTTKIWDFWAGTMPSDLEATVGSTGTVTYTAASAGIPDAILTTAATNADVVRLRTNFDLHVANYEVIDLLVEGIWFESPNETFSTYILLNNAASTAGVQFNHEAANYNARLRALSGASTAVNLPYQWRHGDPARRRSLRLRWDRRKGIAYAMAGDKVISFADVSTAASGTIRPGIAFSTGSALVRKMHISRMTLRLEHN